MTSTLAPDAYQEYLDALLEHKLLLPTGVPGVYGKGAAFETTLERVNAAVSRAGQDQGAEFVSFPPIISRKLLETTEYLNTFPHLAGTVHSFFGSERDHAALLGALDRDEDWAAHFVATDVALAPAACYPVYEMAAGTLPDEGRTFDLQSYCFRHEPSNDPARLQIFRMHEYVRVGTPEQVKSFRDYWLARGEQLLRAIGLDARAVVANDPFFGRAGRMLAATQREQSLKFELVVPICSDEKPTAIVSCNYHQDHFALSFGIHAADGTPAHTACVGFGLERITLALFKIHGYDLADWPPGVRAALGF